MTREEINQLMNTTGFSEEDAIELLAFYGTVENSLHAFGFKIPTDLPARTSSLEDIINAHPALRNAYDA